MDINVKPIKKKFKKNPPNLENRTIMQSNNSTPEYMLKGFYDSIPQRYLHTSNAILLSLIT